MWGLVLLVKPTFRKNMSPPFRVEEIARARRSVRLFLQDKRSNVSREKSAAGA
jgi:hypothetical protein